ncbi:unnamed protein product [Symbiodinium microadriaticum]|nr:unnamed protein product [Symbiodinium sp. KB8]CAE7658952.1 unnamed protein product [Symbiodinium microadriaticum]
MECPSGAPIEELRVFGLGAGLFGLGLTLIASVLVFAAVSCAVRSCRPGGFCAVLLANLALALFLVLLPKGKCRREVPTFGVNRQGQFLDIVTAVSRVGAIVAAALLATETFVRLAAIPRDERLAGVAVRS